MDISEQRKKYLQEIHQFVGEDILKPLDDFIKILGQNKFFSHHTNVIKKLTTEEAKRVYIFTELTKERGTCDEIAKLLERFGKKTVADKLRGFNKSGGPIKILEASKEAAIPVAKRPDPKGDPSASLCYPMTKRIRGRCIIINNDIKTHKETQRFEHVFSELHFKVETHYEKSIRWIKQEMEKLSKDGDLKEDEALVIVITAHGINERIIGYNDGESMLINDVVNYFTIKNCPQLLKVPKVFIFDCCRGNDGALHERATTQPLPKEKYNQDKDTNIEDVTNPDRYIFAKKFVVTNKEWINEHRHMFILYSCSEGQLSHWIKPDDAESETAGLNCLWMSAFAQSFTHAIARYACDESLNEIIKRTNNLMAEFEKIQKSSAPQLKEYCSERNLYFNPGYIKE